MLQPVFVIALRVIFPRMSTPALVRLPAALIATVAWLNKLSSSSVSTRSVFQINDLSVTLTSAKVFSDLRHRVDAFGQRVAGSEYRRFGLHDFLHVQANIRGAAAAVRIADFYRNGRWLCRRHCSPRVSALNRV